MDKKHDVRGKHNPFATDVWFYYGKLKDIRELSAHNFLNLIHRSKARQQLSTVPLLKTMPDIQSLTEEIQRLTQSVAWWNKWVILGMAATAIAALLLVIAQSKVNSESRELSDAQDKLIKLKDERIAEDLREKDLVIAEVNKAASEANLKAGKLELDAVIQRKLTAEANERAAEAQLALEKFRAPRLLSPSQRKGFVEEMSRFKGQRVFLGTSSTAFEVLAFGEQIFEALKEAGVDVVANPEFVSRVIGAAKGIVSRHTTGNERSKAFAVAFSEGLNKRGIVTEGIDNLDEELVPKMEKEHGETYARNGEHFSHVAVAIGDKP